MPDSNQPKNKRLPVALFSLLILATLAVLVFGSAQTGGQTGGAAGTTDVPLVGGDLNPDAPIIQLGDETITQEEFEERFSIALRNIAAQQGLPLNEQVLAQLGNLRPQFLDQLATEQVLLQEAEARGIQVSDEEVEQQITQVRQGLAGSAPQAETGGATGGSTGGGETGGASDEAFQQALSEAGFESEAQLRGLIRDNLRIQQVVNALREEVEVGDEAIQTFYGENQAQFETPEEVCSSHILVETQDEANEILTQLNDGGDFAQLAEERSQDPGSAARGGDLGCVSRGSFVQPFEEAAFNAEVGETVGPVETQFGYHIIRVTDKNEAGAVPLEEVREQIRAQLANERLSQTISDLRENADLETFPENLPQPAAPAAPAAPSGTGGGTGGQ